MYCHDVIPESSASLYTLHPVYIHKVLRQLGGADSYCHNLSFTCFDREREYRFLLAVLSPSFSACNSLPEKFSEQCMDILEYTVGELSGEGSTASIVCTTSPPLGYWWMMYYYDCLYNFSQWPDCLHNFSSARRLGGCMYCWDCLYNFL